MAGERFKYHAGTNHPSVLVGVLGDLEDAVHLYTLFEESLSVARLEDWVTRLGVEDEYERLEHA